jgi:hypothetical protein
VSGGLATHPVAIVTQVKVKAAAHIHGQHASPCERLVAPRTNNATIKQ